jgi:hypothetical protein
MAFLSLIGKLGLDSSGFELGLKRAESSTKKFGASLDSAVKAKIAATFGAAAIGYYSKTVIQSASAINDQSAALGISTERFQTLQYAAKQTGAEMSDVSAAMRHVAKAQAEVLQNPKSAALDAFLKLGVTLDDLRSKNFQQIFDQIAAKLEGGATNTNLMASALVVMGKNAQSVLPMMFEGMSQLEQEAQKLGLVMTDEVIAALDDLGDAMDRAASRSLANWGSGLAKLIDLVGDFSSALKAGAAGVGRWFGTVAAGLEQGLSSGKGTDAGALFRSANAAFSSAFDEVAQQDMKIADAKKEARQRRRDAQAAAAMELPDFQELTPAAAKGANRADVNALQRVGAAVLSAPQTDVILRESLLTQRRIEANTRQGGGASFP